ncbi:MAG: glycosyltransferase family 1 protein [Chthoniobacterales bacterium]
MSPRAGEFIWDAPPAGFLRALRADILYCPFGAVTFHSPGVPTVALIADLLHRDYPTSLTLREHAEREKYIQETVRLATRLQCISRSGLERLAACYEVAPTKVFWTYLPVHRRMDELQTPHEHVLPPPPFFFYPANLWPHKNHELLLRSYAQYRKCACQDAWDLVLTFHEHRREGALRSLAQALGIAPHVSFAGFVANGTLRGLFQTAGALVFPSLHEGFGIPLLEAMHYGVPIITGTDFALGEVAGDACYAVNVRDETSVATALLKVSKDSQLRNDLIKRGRERLQLFDLQVAAKTLLAVFDSLAPGGSKFPRPSRRWSVSGVLTVATPASPRRWQIELLLSPTACAREIAVYLDDVFFGSWARESLEETVFSFYCKPRGRLLQLQPGWNEPSEGSKDSLGIARIMARSDGGERVLLYEKATNQSRAS